MVIFCQENVIDDNSANHVVVSVGVKVVLNFIFYRKPYDMVYLTSHSRVMHLGGCKQF